MSKNPAVGGSLPVLEHVHPPVVVGPQNADVVGHQVDDVPHPVRAQRRDELVEIGALADLGIEGVMVDHVIAVQRCRHAPGSRASSRRG